MDWKDTRIAVLPDAIDVIQGFHIRIGNLEIDGSVVADMIEAARLRQRRQAEFFALACRRAKPIAGATFDAPPPTIMIDRRLVAESLLFGVGWGLAGSCPGPAVVNLAMVPSEAFVVPMVAGLVASAMWAAQARLSCYSAIPVKTNRCTRRPVLTSVV